jgi:hypothetical protein
MDGVPAVMLLISCSIKAATCARNLEQWNEAERFALNATVILDRLEPKLGDIFVHKWTNFYLLEDLWRACVKA